jgi:hypothetical protein
MRTEEEIKSNLEETKVALKDAQEWATVAHASYWKDKKEWGNEADYGEAQTANSLVSELTSKINTLNWVLGIHP